MSTSSRIFARGVVVFLLAAAAVGSTSGCIKKDEEKPVDPRARLESETGTRWVVKLDPATGTPRIATAVDPIKPSAVDGVSYEDAARRFLDTYKELFALKDVAQDLAFIDVVEHRGEAAARFQQRAGGLPVDRKTLVVWFRADRSVAMISGSTHPRAIDAVKPPAVTPDAATAAVEADLRKRHPAYDRTWLAAPPQPRSVLVPDGPGAKLAWAFDLRLESAAVSTTYSYRVDANDGALLEAIQTREGIEGSGVDALGLRRTIQVTEDPVNKGTFIMIQAPEGKRTVISTGSVQPSEFPLKSKSLTTWDDRTAAAGGAGAAVSAHANLAAIEDYFRERFAWSSFDNKGTPLKVFVHDPGAAAQYAYWDQISGIHFWDGDIHAGGRFKPIASAIDVCAHEFMHGVVQFRVAGGIAYVGESGAVSEGIADIFGAFAKKALGGGKVERFGDAFFEPGFRDLSDPTNPGVGQNFQGPDYHQPDTYTKRFVGFTDNGGVHINSGIVTNAWYLMTVGGKNRTTQLEVKSPLGFDKSEDLWWTVLPGLLSGGTIKDLAEQTISTALRKYKASSDEMKAVACAWVATEVIAPEDLKADFDISCAEQKCTTPEAGADACTCRATDPKDGTLCRVNTSPVCTEVQTFAGNHGAGCTGYVLREVTVSRCFCQQSDGNILCPKPYQFTPPRGCPEEGGFKSYFGTAGAGCSGNFAATDPDGNEINQTGSGTLADCSIEGTEQKWESAGGTLDCNSAAGGGPGPSPCP